MEDTQAGHFTQPFRQSASRQVRSRPSSCRPAEVLLRAQADDRNQRLDVGGRAHRHIGLAEVTIVGRQRFGSAQPFRQRGDLAKHRHDLLLVVRRRNRLRGDHQKALRRHHRPPVEALIETAKSHRLLERPACRQIRAVGREVALKMVSRCGFRRSRPGVPR
jgi:hypothetical protein